MWGNCTTRPHRFSRKCHIQVFFIHLHQFYAQKDLLCVCVCVCDKPVFGYLVIYYY